MQTEQAAPYAGLTPDTVLNAVDSVGLLTDGRQLALNSYENRVFQVGLEDGRFVVVKFYRPLRWTDEQILEEHAFTAELAELEVPAVPAMAFDGRTLHAYEGFRFTVFPRSGGRAPNLDDPAEPLAHGRVVKIRGPAAAAGAPVLRRSCTRIMTPAAAA